MAGATAQQQTPSTISPEEEQYVLRNRRGVPVGVRPHIRWTPWKIAIWVLITAAGVLGWTMLAVVRGEQVNTLWFVITAVCTYAIAYRFYGLYIQRRIMRPNDRNATPAERINNGKDFDPTHRVVLYGHHFAAIAGAGPLVGPVLAAQMGYLPGTLWIIIGVCLAGAVQDMLVLFFSMRRGGRSLGQMATDEIGKVGGVVATVIVLVMLMIVLAVLAMVCVNALAASPWGVFSVGCTIPIAICMGLWLRYVQPGKITQVSLVGFAVLILVIISGRWVSQSSFGQHYLHLSPTTLVWAMIIYGFFAAVLPVWLLLTPRDYLSTFMKVGTIVVLAVGIVVVRPIAEMPAVTEFASNTDGPVFAGTLFPFLFITIACGALSGMHAQVSSGTTPKMIQKESQARMIGYGGMLMESFVAIMAMAAAVSLNQGIYFGMNTSEATVDGLAGPAVVRTTDDRNEITAEAVTKLGVTDAHGNSIQARWESWDAEGRDKTYVGAQAFSQLAKDVGEPSVTSRTGGAPTLAVGIAHILHQVGGGRAMMGFWYHFAIMFEALFILSAVDAVTRVARFQLSDALGNGIKKFKDPSWRPGAWMTTAVVGIPAADGRHRPSRRHPDPLSAVRHRQPAHRGGGAAADLRDGGAQGLHEMAVDTGHTLPLRHRGDLHRLLAEDLLHRQEHRLLAAVARRPGRSAGHRRPGADRDPEGHHPQHLHPGHAVDRLPGDGGLRRGLRGDAGGEDSAQPRVHQLRGRVRRVELLRTRQPVRHETGEEAGRRV